MKKYLTAFFTFLGYVAFISLLGAGILIYMGYRKSLAAEAAVMSASDGHTVKLTPEKQTDTTTPSVSAAAPPEFEPVSARPRKAKPKAAPVSAPAAAVRATVKNVQPETRNWKPATRNPQPETRNPQPETRNQKPKPSTRAKAKKAAPVQTELPPCTLSYQVTDNGANPRTGRGIVNVYETTELERQVALKMELQQLQRAAEQIRNPPIHESGLVKLFRNKK